MTKRHLASVADLENQLNVCFATRTYGEGLTTIDCELICVSEGFEQFYRARRPRWSRKKLSVELEVKIDLDTYCSIDNNRAEAGRYLALECYKTIQIAVDLKLLNGFDKKRFLHDLSGCLIQDGVLPG